MIADNIFIWIDKNISFFKDYFYYRLFNYDEKLYEKLNNYHNIMTIAKKFVKKYIIYTNYILTINDEVRNEMKDLNQKISTLYNEQLDFINEFDENFDEYFEDIEEIRKEFHEDYAFISCYILKFSIKNKENIREILKKNVINYVV